MENEDRAQEAAAPVEVAEKKEDTLNISREELTEVLTKSFEAALKSFQSSTNKEKIEESHNKINAVINNSASTLLKAPNVPKTNAVDYVKSVLQEDAERRMASSDRSNRLNFVQDSLKWRIIAEHEYSGATPEEIAEKYKDCFE